MSHKLGCVAATGCGFFDSSDVVIQSGIVTVRVESGSLTPEIAAVPIPNVGTGLPGLILACSVLLILARRRLNTGSLKF
jgi:hypothetical protein